MKTNILKWATYLVGCALMCPAALGQITAQIKSQPGSPIQITSARCSSAPKGGAECTASLQVSTAGTWTAYGLIWRATYENGSTLVNYTSTDRTIGPGNNGPAFKPGEIVQHETGAFGKKLAATNADLRLVDVSVEVDFAIPSSGRPWGNTQSIGYQRIVGARSGYGAAMAYLRRIYQTQGAGAMHAAVGVP